MRIKGGLGRLFLLAALLVTDGQRVQAQCETWQPLVASGQTGTSSNVNCLTTWNGSLVAGGNFFSAGGEVRRYIARWDGTAWHSFTSGGQTGVDAPFGTQIFALAEFNGDLIAAGRFDTAGGQTMNNIARWDGASWHPLTSGGQIGVNSSVRALAVYNGELIAGGDFITAGGQTVNCIARWNGTVWLPIFAGGQTGVGSSVQALAIWNNSLIAGGNFSTAGGLVVNLVAAWNGSTWAAFASNGQTGVGGGSFQLNSLAVWNNSLVAGGGFTTAGAQPVNGIARWDGFNWNQFVSGGQIGMSGGLPTQVYALTVFNGHLIAAGSFANAGDQVANHIARWDGTAWAPFTVGGVSGVDFTVLALAVSNMNLVAGGSFQNAGGTFVSRIAGWEDCQTPCIEDIAPPGGDGVVNVSDLLAIINSWGTCSDPQNCPGDIAPAGGDGAIDVSDLLAIINSWGSCD